MRLIFLILLISVFLIDNAYAYVGPGLGLGAIGAFVGVVVAVLLAIVGVIWYPLKRMLRKFKAAKADTNQNNENARSSER
jgi:O-antigen/teichoic acid export membrane protein